MDTDTVKLFQEAKNTLLHSYSPYSKYKVAAGIWGGNNKIYTGTNIENASYGLTLCAEAVAIGNMIVSGETKIKALLVLANHDMMCTPCGACRQRIAEFAHKDTIIYMCNSAQIVEQVTLSELLPYAFSNELIER